MFQLKKNFCRENKTISIVVPITFILILATGIYYGQKLLSILPLFVSLAVMVLQAKVNRYAWLLGSLNSLLYCYYYFTMGLMSNFFYAIIISFPMQMITFFNWSRKQKEKVSGLRKMSAMQLAFGVIAFLLLWGAVFFGISLFENASYSVLDTLTTVLGLAVTILTMLRFSEYVILQSVSCVITIIMYAVIFFGGSYESITHLIYAVYCLICVVLAAMKMHKIQKDIAK